MSERQCVRETVNRCGRELHVCGGSHALIAACTAGAAAAATVQFLLVSGTLRYETQHQFYVASETIEGDS